MYHIFACAAPDARSAAHALLAGAAREVWGLEELPEVALGARGKPYFPQYSHLHFNLSHSGSLALCALGDAPVGVDIEVLRPRRDLPALAARAFSAGELAWLEGRGYALEDFYTLWTRKEALVKYTGEGIAALREQVLPLPGEQAPGLSLRSWAGEGWRAALCGEGELPEEILWRSAFL